MNGSRPLPPAADRGAWLAPILAGLCPALAVTVRVSTAMWMALALMAALAVAGLVGALLGSRLPRWAGSTASLLSIVAAVAGLDAAATTLLPGERSALGIYLPASALACLVLGAAPAAAASPAAAARRTLATGIGFAAGLLAVAVVREGLGAGTITLPATGEGHPIALPGLSRSPAAGLLAPAGGFIVAGYLAALARRLARARERRP